MQKSGKSFTAFLWKIRKKGDTQRERETDKEIRNKSRNMYMQIKCNVAYWTRLYDNELEWVRNARIVACFKALHMYHNLEKYRCEEKISNVSGKKRKSTFHFVVP